MDPHEFCRHTPGVLLLANGDEIELPTISVRQAAWLVTMMHKLAAEGHDASTIVGVGCRQHELHPAEEPEPQH